MEKVSVADQLFTSYDGATSQRKRVEVLALLGREIIRMLDGPRGDASAALEICGDIEGQIADFRTIVSGLATQVQTAVAGSATGSSKAKGDSGLVNAQEKLRKALEELDERTVTACAVESEKVAQLRAEMAAESKAAVETMQRLEARLDRLQAENDVLLEALERSKTTTRLNGHHRANGAAKNPVASVLFSRPA